MSDAPERIIVKWTAKGNGQVLTPASSEMVAACGANYVRESVLVAERAAADAAIAKARAEGMDIMPEHVVRVAAMMIDVLHVLDTEAAYIANATNRSGGVDGVQVLEDAEKIIKAAAGFIASGLRGADVATPFAPEAQQ